MNIYTDGSANPNPGPGAFGVIALDNDNFFVYNIHRESSKETTNNREELKAILYAIKTFGVNIFEKKEEEFVEIPYVFSDSAYAVNTFNSWMFNWEKNNWITSSGKLAENIDIIKEYYDLYSKGYRINLVRIPGHCGLIGNELADEIAGGPPNYNEEYIDLWWKI